MSGDSKPPDEKAGRRPSENRRIPFDTTRWSLVLAVGMTDPARSAAALEELCRRYWPPLYVFIRRKGFDRHAAEDLTQAFFANILDSEMLLKIDRSKGRFRSFLLSALKHFLSNEEDRRKAVKRGGAMKIISFDEAEADTLYLSEPADTGSPEQLFDRRWALGQMEACLRRLRSEFEERGKRELFLTLEPKLVTEPDNGWMASAAMKLGMNEGAVRVSLHRMRRRFGDLLREEISNTVASEEELEDELRHMSRVLNEFG